MKTIYAIRDRIANELVGLSMYMLFVFRTDQQAIRYFQDCINDPKSILNKHPSDYELVALGILADTAEGEIIKTNGLGLVVATGDAILAAQEPNLVREN